MKSIFFFLLLVMVADSASAEVYKWTDENGIIHYSDKKPENQDYTELEFEVSSYKNVSYQPSNISYIAPEAESEKKVVMFSTSWCGVCKKAKKYFRKNRIRYTNHDVEKSRKAKKLYKQLGARGVPVIIVGTKRMNGFTEAGFERIYN